MMPAKHNAVQHWESFASTERCAALNRIGNILRRAIHWTDASTARALDDCWAFQRTGRLDCGAAILCCPRVVDVRKVKGGVEYVFMNERCRFTGLLPHAGKRPAIEIGDSIGFAEERRKLFVRDRNGEIHRLRYLLQQLTPPPPPPVPVKR